MIEYINVMWFVCFGFFFQPLLVFEVNSCLHSEKRIVSYIKSWYEIMQMK